MKTHCSCWGYRSPQCSYMICSTAGDMAHHLTSPPHHLLQLHWLFLWGCLELLPTTSSSTSSTHNTSRSTSICTTSTNTSSSITTSSSSSSSPGAITRTLSSQPQPPLYLHHSLYHTSPSSSPARLRPQEQLPPRCLDRTPVNRCDHTCIWTSSIATPWPQEQLHHQSTSSLLVLFHSTNMCQQVRCQCSHPCLPTCQGQACSTHTGHSNRSPTMLQQILQACRRHSQCSNT